MIRALLRSFRFAAAGIWFAVRTQRNMRIHICALLTVVIASVLSDLPAVYWCVEILCCMIVLSLELINTALETLANVVTEERTIGIGHAKDAAAGAVLLSCAGSVAAAAVIYGMCGYISVLAGRLMQFGPVQSIICIVLIIIVFAVFVFYPEKEKVFGNKKV